MIGLLYIRYTATHVFVSKNHTTVSDVFEKFKWQIHIALYCEFLEIKFKFE